MTPDKWNSACGLYTIATVGESTYTSNVANILCGIAQIVSMPAFNLANTFYFAAFPNLVRNRPHLIEAEQSVRSGQMSPEEYADLDMRERSKVSLNRVFSEVRNHDNASGHTDSQLSNYSLATSAFGSCLVLILGLVVPFTVGVDTIDENTKVYSVLIAYFTAIWILYSLPWFLTEQYRPGQRLPKGSSYLTIGPK